MRPGDGGGESARMSVRGIHMLFMRVVKKENSESEEDNEGYAAYEEA